MRIIFAGTPDFARVALERLHASGFDIALVLTQPDRPAGRGLKLQASPVKQFALAHGIPVTQPRSLRLDGKYPADAAAARDSLLAARAEAMVVAAYGLILPQWVLDLPVRGCFNIHASLLPRWRGAAPIHRAIEAGDAETGITIMQMDAGLDTGDMLLMHTTPITGRDTTATLHDRLADLGGKLIVLALNEAAAGRLKPVRQPAEGVTYAHKIEKAESQVDWSNPASVIERRIRAFDPFPGASGSLAGETIKLWKSHTDSMKRPSDAGNGQILLVNDDGVRVVCGDGVLCVTELQRAGAKRLAAADFLRGFPVGEGARFDAPASA
ncbi:methionyl-tRNA formyltransferase [Candidatus Skiveiella danica]|uniref:methionyl-tRNA formyltransferase n=1 Tax=Candidatus Skiveiella danica TaxID=3386177 RepID=UPI0009C5E10E|nr:MAG: Methionyl-tRNA formyltransferase [Alphaproteobacteria bacterium ADurb.Bin100]